MSNAAKETEELEILQEIQKLEIDERKLRSQNGIKYYVPNQHQLKAHQSDARTILLCGGNRIGKCLGSETKIYDPALGKEREVGSIDSDFHVLAWDGTGLRITKSEKPFRKTKDKLYKIKLSNGGEFTASMSHVVLTPDGFRTISDVQVGTSLFLPQTILEPFQSIHGEDGPSFYQRVEGSQFDYRSYSHLCDALLQRVKDSDPKTSPLQDDVQGHTSFSVSSYTGGQGNTLSYSHLSYPTQFHLSSSSGVSPTWDLHADTLSNFSYTTSTLADLHSLTVTQSNYESFLPESKNESFQYPKHADSIRPLETSHVVVMSIAYIRTDYKWDFTVPIYHNYFAGGCIHHNSTFGAVELCLHLTRDYPSWFSKKRRFYQPIKAVVVGETNQFIEKVLEPKLKQYLPTAYIKHTKRVTGNYLSRIECVDGSIVDFLTKEQSDMAVEGADWDFYWGDEPQSRRKFDGIKRGLVDRQGLTVLTFTPLIEPWMKEELVDRADGVNIDVITASIYENRFDIKGNKILSNESIEAWEKTLSEDVAQTRIHGKFFHLRGTVYTEFSDIHCQTFQYNHPDPVICVLDPHDRQPHHVIWAIVTPDDDIYVHTELDVHCTVEELAKSIKRIERDIFSEQTGPDGRQKSIRTGYRVRRRLIDPNFGRKPLITTGRNMIQELQLAGCGGWQEADDPIEEGHLKVKDYLHYDVKSPISLTNKPKLYFHKGRVPNTIHSLRNYQYQEWIGKTNDERDPKEEPKQKDTHGADCIRYLCMSNPTYERMKGYKDYELSENPY